MSPHFIQSGRLFSFELLFPICSCSSYHLCLFVVIFNIICVTRFVANILDSVICLFVCLFVLDGKVSELALDALLRRCKEVLQKYVEDERLSGKCPLPRWAVLFEHRSSVFPYYLIPSSFFGRTRMSEMSFVMKAISTLLASLKTAVRGNPKVGECTEELWCTNCGRFSSLSETCIFVH